MCGVPPCMHGILFKKHVHWDLLSVTILLCHMLCLIFATLALLLLLLTLALLSLLFGCWAAAAAADLVITVWAGTVTVSLFGSLVEAIHTCFRAIHFFFHVQSQKLHKAFASGSFRMHPDFRLAELLIFKLAKNDRFCSFHAELLLHLCTSKPLTHSIPLLLLFACHLQVNFCLGPVLPCFMPIFIQDWHKVFSLQQQGGNLDIWQFQKSMVGVCTHALHMLCWICWFDMVYDCVFTCVYVHLLVSMHAMRRLQRNAGQVSTWCLLAHALHLLRGVFTLAVHSAQYMSTYVERMYFVLVRLSWYACPIAACFSVWTRKLRPKPRIDL